MQKNVEKLNLNVFRRLEISLKVNDFFFQRVTNKILQKIGQIMFLIRCCFQEDLKGFSKYSNPRSNLFYSCIGKSFTLRIFFFGIMGYLGGLQKIRQMSKNWKNRLQTH
jgi:hypothetical protein